MAGSEALSKWTNNSMIGTQREDNLPLANGQTTIPITVYVQLIKGLTGQTNME